jgi:hypothetical protein
VIKENELFRRKKKWLLSKEARRIRKRKRKITLQKRLNKDVIYKQYQQSTFQT